ncbi:hypothetical protein O6H91_20G073600 [Diphasiastrum complanatum]|uniref:Uncharacterized protein n=2 Tax=Diphasiastrum complanatum TaxID=34168 RepID=A0ACC2ART7_DIPCM|nr:hypothetical protein O6H91_20G073600 [Diphasiastrum complanatum]KAJ7520238.1 hypothetical protein O6H91_20G073600 [Diphasiastrum complanatum]
MPVKVSTTYLLRVWFYYGNYDGLNAPPTFDLISNANEWLSVSLSGINSKYIYFEFIMPTLTSSFSVCLGRNPPADTPFISALELRPLASSMYQIVQQKNLVLGLHLRRDIGSLSSKDIRFPDDPFDRIWSSDYDLTSNLVNINTSKAVSAGGTYEQPPSAVLRTAKTTATSSSMMYFNYPLDQGLNIKCYTVFYFAEIQNLGPMGKRIFDIFYTNSINETQLFFGPENVEKAAGGPYLGAEVYANAFNLSDLVNNFTFVPRPQSTVGPLVNAVEILLEIGTTVPGTASVDDQALEGLKSNWNLSSWTGDPCLPVSYTWEWLECSLDSPPRVIAVKLSNMNLSGSIPLEITNLTTLTTLWLDGNNLTGVIPDLSSLSNLQSLHLQNNQITGPIPNSLSKLPNLKELFLQNNNLNGSIPQDLANNASLVFRYSGNPHLCQPGNSSCTISEGMSQAPAPAPGRTTIYNTSSETPSPAQTRTSDKNSKKSSNIGIIIGVVIGVIALLIVLVASVIHFSCFHKHKASRRNSGVLNMQQGPANEPYEVLFIDSKKKISYDEVKFITKDFQNKIGEGGFGPVYYGKLSNGQEVAVKLLSKTSHQGSKEFYNEVELLTKIHHKYLVSFVGFCEELGHCVLLYEYLSGGNLRENLYGKLSNEHLNWNRRLNIALNSAEGLEYLHKGCLPAIIHRDVKSSNILLNQSYIAKVADFGLSKFSPEEGATHITTNVKGTIGYLDPEMMHTHQLTEKSDVFSFGVVLLEIIAGRSPIDTKLPRDSINLVEWARRYLNEGRIEELVDPRLPSYNIEAMWKVAEIAILSVEPRGINRPKMTDVVLALKEAIAIENGSRSSFSDHSSSRQSFSLSKTKTSSLSGLQKSIGEKEKTPWGMSDSSVLEGR